MRGAIALRQHQELIAHLRSSAIQEGALELWQELNAVWQ